MPSPLVPDSNLESLNKMQSLKYQRSSKSGRKENWFRSSEEIVAKNSVPSWVNDKTGVGCLPPLDWRMFRNLKL